MFKIVEEEDCLKPTKEEFDAVKEMAKENFDVFLFSFGFFMIWFIMLAFALFNNILLTIFVAGSVVLAGVSFFMRYFIPSKYKILYKKNHCYKK